MPSPFPGMDPFLEQETIRHDFRKRFLPAAAAHLASQVLPRYIVLIDEHVYLRDMDTEDDRPVGRPDHPPDPHLTDEDAAWAESLSGEAE